MDETEKNKFQVPSSRAGNGGGVFSPPSVGCVVMEHLIDVGGMRLWERRKAHARRSADGSEELLIWIKRSIDESKFNVLVKCRGNSTRVEELTHMKPQQKKDFASMWKCLWIPKLPKRAHSSVMRDLARVEPFDLISSSTTGGQEIRRDSTPDASHSAAGISGKNAEGICKDDKEQIHLQGFICKDDKEQIHLQGSICKETKKSKKRSNLKDNIPDPPRELKKLEIHSVAKQKKIGQSSGTDQAPDDSIVVDVEKSVGDVTEDLMVKENTSPTRPCYDSSTHRKTSQAEAISRMEHEVQKLKQEVSRLRRTVLYLKKQVGVTMADEPKGVVFEEKLKGTKTSAMSRPTRATTSLSYSFCQRPSSTEYEQVPLDDISRPRELVSSKVAYKISPSTLDDTGEAKNTKRSSEESRSNHTLERETSSLPKEDLHEDEAFCTMKKTVNVP